VIWLALPAKSIARAAALASAAVGAVAIAAPVAHASGVGPIFLYRHNAGVHRNCAGGNHEIKNDGVVGIKRYIYAYGPIHSESQPPNITIYYRKQYSATRADKQYWCYKGSFYNEYFAANNFSRTAYDPFACSGAGGCVPLPHYYSPWKRL
jgi:hypothetical protein